MRAATECARGDLSGEFRAPAIKSSAFREEVLGLVQSLSNWLQARDYAGWDPYDGLESALFQATPLRHSKLARLVVIQLNKRCPINLRKLLRVPRGRNPKGIALCASAFLKRGLVREATYLLKWLMEHSSEGYAGISWGYNFDWQSRSFFAPKGSPNAVCTIFAGNAFLDAFESSKEALYLSIAQRCCEFLLEHLLIQEGGEAHLRYLPSRDTQIHNINLLGGAFLARLACTTQDEHLTYLARTCVKFSVDRQRADGSWPYGEESNQRWIDNYHTGFNLVSLSHYARYTHEETFWPATMKGYEYWNRNFFLSNGAPKLYHNRTYPIDVHCVAQALITWLEFISQDPSAGEKIVRTFRWALANMKSREDTFHYQAHRLYTIRIAYERWGQAWMLYGLSSLAAALSSDHLK